MNGACFLDSYSSAKAYQQHRLHRETSPALFARLFSRARILLSTTKTRRQARQPKVRPTVYIGPTLRVD